MATKAEQFKAEQQRNARPAPAPKAEPHAANGHAAKKAVYAREEVAPDGHPSRKSTRKSANHAKTDTGMVRAEQMKENTPETKARKNRAEAQRVHGGGGAK